MIDIGGMEEPETPPGASMNGGGSPDGGAAIGSPDNEPGLAGIQNSALAMFKMVCKSLEGVLPFLVLIGAKVMYDHRLGECYLSVPFSLGVSCSDKCSKQFKRWGYII